jgi:hypothetical protein
VAGIDEKLNRIDEAAIVAPKKHHRIGNCGQAQGAFARDLRQYCSSCRDAMCAKACLGITRLFNDIRLIP